MGEHSAPKMVRTQEPYLDGTEMLRDPVRTADSAEMDSDFRVLEWQQLANESAMKQELMLQPKMTREGLVGESPNDVRLAVKVATNRPTRGKLSSTQKASWME